MRLDPGCEVTLIPKSFVDAGPHVDISPSTQRIWATKETEIEVTGETTVALELYDRFLTTFALISTDIEEIMLGSDWLRQHSCLRDFANGNLYIDG